MALVNAFGDIALDASVQQVKTAVDQVKATIDDGISVTGPLTDSQLRASAVPVAIASAIGSADIKDLGVAVVAGDTGLVTNSVIHGLSTGGGGGYIDVKVTPSGALTVEVGDSVLPTGAATEATLSAVNGKLPALASGRVPVDGSGVTQPVSGSVSVTGSVAVTGPLTDAQLRASAVPVSGTVTANTGLTQPLTDAQLRASAVPVSAASLPLPTGAATETTLSALNAKILTSSDNPSQDVVALPVRIAPQKHWNASLPQVGSGLLSPMFTQIGTTGTGMTVNQSAGNLVITAGTTANAETTIRSVNSFNGAFTLHQLTTTSQRIINNNFFIEAVDVIGDGLAYNIVNTTTVDVTKVAHGYTAQNVGQRMDIGVITGAAGIPMEAVIASIPSADVIRFTVAGWPASGTGTCSLTGWNKIELLYTGTSGTVLAFNTRRSGWQNTAVNATINTSASGHIAAVNVANGICSLADQANTSAGLYANRNAWRTNVPDPEVELFVQIRARNGATAPASNTTWTIGFVRVEDYTPAQVDIVGTKQQSTANSLPVNVISGTIGTVNAAFLGASTFRIGAVGGAGIWYDDSATALAANATFTGTSRDLTVTATATAFANAATYAQEMRLSAESDVSGTLWLEVSRDNTNWRRVKSVATAAVTGGGQYAEIVHRPSWRYARVGFTNGATIQARFTINSILTAI